MIEILSVIASIFELSGIYLLSTKKRFGFLLNMLGAVCWISYSFISHNAIGLILVCSCGLVINFNGFRKWRTK